MIKMSWILRDAIVNSRPLLAHNDVRENQPTSYRYSSQNRKTLIARLTFKEWAKWDYILINSRTLLFSGQLYLGPDGPYDEEFSEIFIAARGTLLIREGHVRLIGTGLWRNSCGREAEDGCVGADCRGSGSRPCHPPSPSPSGNRTELSLSLCRSLALLSLSLYLSFSAAHTSLRIPGRPYIAGFAYKGPDRRYEAGKSYSLLECTRSVEQHFAEPIIAARPHSDIEYSRASLILSQWNTSKEIVISCLAIISAFQDKIPVSYIPNNKEIQDIRILKTAEFSLSFISQKYFIQAHTIFKYKKIMISRRRWRLDFFKYNFPALHCVLIK